MPIVSVLMPTFRQARFIRRAIDSLYAQALQDWELWIIDDGSPDNTRQEIQSYLEDPRIHYERLDQNQGMGAALNLAMERASAPLIAYLPSDDLYYPDHLASLVAILEENPAAVLAYSGIRHHYNRYAAGQIDGYSLQAVQVLHRLTGDRWVERQELVTDDLERMFWEKLRPHGAFAPAPKVTCEWVSHPPLQRHLILREPEGGLNTYRQYYGVQHPIHIHTTVGNAFDEIEHYRRFRDQPARTDGRNGSQEGLKILLVGELAYNPERILTLEERGHKLFGLWMRRPYWYNTVGPLPFGRVQDVPYENWQEEVRRIQPDLIYALLNWQAVPLAHEVLSADLGIPFVWHFKEGPFICLEKGTWELLVDLHRYAQGQVFSSPEMQAWYETAIPGCTLDRLWHVLDGDLPKKEWFGGAPSPRLSDREGEFHTVVPGRPIGLHPPNVAELAENGIHLHFYGDFTHGQWLEWIEKTRRLAPRHIHLHHQVDQEGWVSEFSQYDAGWLHYFKSENQGDIRRSNWDDLNYPARIATLAAAGLPLLQRDNTGSVVATQTLAKQLDIGVFFTTMEELRHRLADRARMDELRANVWRQREVFTFDHHVDRLIDFFYQVIQETGSSKQPAGQVILHH